jgi:clan AA aspartic protease (TIGR02281 family)
MRSTKLILLLFLILHFSAFVEAFADTLYLKNGRSVTGLIKREDEKKVEIEICQGGSAEFNRNEIQKIERTPSEESVQIREAWEQEKKRLRERLEKQKAEEALRPKGVAFSQEGESIKVNVTLNKNVNATFMLDTGASFVALRKPIAEKLGINLANIKPDIKIGVADGRQIEAKQVILESIKVENFEANNVEAAVILDESKDYSFGDGLLGMSFLKKFNFKIDHKEKRLILERI